MGKYVYPAVFKKEGERYAVNFPDLQGCYTCGDSLYDAIYMAERFRKHRSLKRLRQMQNPSLI